MTRKKVKLQYILSDSARKATYKKRKNGLIKKVNEISTLCGVEACAIVYSPFEVQPEVWPSASGVQSVVSKFKNMPEMDKNKKMFNQENFLRQRINKATEQLRKQGKDNREKEVNQFMYQCLNGRGVANLNVVDLGDLQWMIDHTIKDINHRSETLRNGSSSSSNVVPSSGLLGDVVLMAAAGAGASSSVVGGGQEQEQEQGLEQAPESLQRGDIIMPIADELNMDFNGQQWFLDLMSTHQEPPTMGFGGDEVVLPFGDNNASTALWSFQT